MVAAPAVPKGPGGEKSEKPLPKMFTFQEVATLLGVSKRILQKWAAAGMFSTFKFGKRSVRIAEPTLRALMAEARSGGGHMPPEVKRDRTRCVNRN